MRSTREMIVLLIALSALVGLCNTCHPSQASGCTNYVLLNSVRVIPLPNPERLVENCRELRDGLNCLTGPGVFGNCDDQAQPMKQVYITMLEVIKIPCQTASQEYQSGRACLRKESGLPQTMSKCYSKNRRNINSNYCSGMTGFLNCVTTDMKKIPSCNDTDTERDIIHAMIATHINGGTVTCEKIPVPSLKKTTTTTTTTTTPTTTTSARPTVASTPQKPVVVAALSTRKAEVEVTTTTEMSSSNSKTTINPSYRVGKSQPSSAGSQNTAFLGVHAVAMLVTQLMSAW